ncbi:hypothetical protein C3L33_05469, partial [Rhododendron williamsianum]
MALTIPTLFLLLFLSSKFPCSTAQTWIKSGYWFSGSELPVTDINSPLFTHLICAFAGLNSSTYQLSISSSDAQSFSTFTPTVKQKNPTVTTLLSIGGGSANSSTFSSMVSQSGFRKSFIESSIKTARSYGFNGLDFCWVSASTSSEMTNMATLFNEWRLAIESESRNSSGSQLILTMAVQFSPDLENASFPIESIKKNLDWVHVMAYDYYMPSWWNYTAAFAALYDPGSEVSTEYGINAWIDGGLSANKLVLGLPFYGYAWTLVNPNDSAVGAPAKGTAITDDGSMSYKDLKAYMQRYGAVSEYNATYVVNYCVIGSSWIAYDDVEVVKIKVAYAKKMNLLGYFVWQVPYDDENWAYDLWKCGKGMEFMDPLLDDTNSSCKLVRCMQIALLCVQENPADRPSMLELSSMLKNEIAAVNIPKRPAFSTRRDEDEVQESTSKQEIWSVGDVSFTQTEAR